ncbi:MAG: nuclear transport factor 2 family protein [Polyangia bacterium]
MAEPREVVEHFYRCFAAHDGSGMAACYTDDATFSDPVFKDLKGDEVGGMWKMLTARSGDLVVELEGITGPDDKADGASAAETHYIAHWTARYSFTATKRKVVNRVTSNIYLRGDKFARQRDDFDLAAWLKQALGPTAALLGWTGLPTRLIRTQAQKGLTAYMKKSATSA